jgi:hypothetical protein
VINGYITGTGAAPYGNNGGREDVRRTYKRLAEAITARHRFYAVPQQQIDLSKQGGQETLTQNPGW